MTATTIPMNDKTVGHIRKAYAAALAPEDLFILLAHAAGRSKEFLFAHPEHVLSDEEYRKAVGMFERRKRSEPVAYIVGEKEFFGRSFLVTENTLIPRPETELLVERAIEELRRLIADETAKPAKNILVADMGTGSGAIIVSVAAELMQEKSMFAFHAIDISAAALRMAEANAERSGVGDIVSFHQGSLLEPITGSIVATDELVILANLPYLSSDIYRSSQDDVRLYEPKDALESGADGLDHYRELFSQIRKMTEAYPSLGIRGIFEIGPEQDALITDLFKGTFPRERSSILPDLSGRSRIFSFVLGHE